ncbi:hypothetical protein MRY87_13115 [bacterium]|nr:hypothetical protein [bacterium]
MSDNSPSEEGVEEQEKREETPFRKISIISSSFREVLFPARQDSLLREGDNRDRWNLARRREAYHEAHLVRHLDDVLEQHYPDIEHIFVSWQLSPRMREMLDDYPHVISPCSQAERYSLPEQLNRALQVATGELFLFLDISARLTPGALFDANRRISSCEVLWGRARCIRSEMQEGEASQDDIAENIPRTREDLLRYWIPHTLPEYSSVFFHRTVLEKISQRRVPSERALQQVFREDVPLAALYEFSLRLHEVSPSSFFSPSQESAREEGEAVSSSQPIYTVFRDEVAGEEFHTDISEESDGVLPLYHELSRVYRRENQIICKGERACSVVIASNRHSGCKRSLLSCLQQSCVDFEMIPLLIEEEFAVQEGGNEEFCRTLLEEAAMAEDPRCRVFPRAFETPIYPNGLREIISEVRSPVVVLLFAGEALAPSAILQICNTFQQDSLGALLFSPRDEGSRHRLLVEGHERALFQVTSLFEPSALPRAAAFRTVALKEVLSLPFSRYEPLAVRELFLFLQYKGWGMQVASPELTPKFSTNTLRMSTVEEALVTREQLQASLITTLARVRAGDPFAVERSRSGHIIEFPESTTQAAEEYLQQHPIRLAPHKNLMGV